MSDFPGILIVETLQGPTVYVSDSSGDIGSWSFVDLKNNPKLFLECLDTVMNTVKYGPASVRQILKENKNNHLPSGRKICCNVCNNQFIINETIFRTPLNVNEKIVYEYQCSEKCYESRKLKLFTKENRNGLLSKLKEIYQKPAQV